MNKCKRGKFLGGLTKEEIEIVKWIREEVPTRTCKHSISFWKFWLWKYRKFQVPVIGIKMAIEIVQKVKKLYE